VSIDRANLNFPIRPGFEYKAFIHWDYDPEEKPVNVQGVLALVDQTDENMGGFQCVPELYRDYDTWKLTQPEDRNRFQPDISGFEPEKVKMEAGDLLIFNSCLAHGIRANYSEKVRVAQYISMRRRKPCANGESNLGKRALLPRAMPFRAIHANGSRPNTPLQT